MGRHYIGTYIFACVPPLCGCADVQTWKQSPESDQTVAIVEIKGGLATGAITLVRVDGQNGSAEISTPVVFRKPEGHVAWMGQFMPGTYVISNAFASGGTISGSTWLCKGSLQFEARPGQALYLGQYSVNTNSFVRLSDNFDQAKADLDTLPGISSPLKRAEMVPVATIPKPNPC